MSRAAQDEYAVRSQQRAAAGEAAGRFEGERLPLELKDRKGNRTTFATDEHVRAKTSIEDLQKLSPVFANDGSVTPGNSSGIPDVAAAIVVLSEAAMQESDAQPLGRIVDYEIVGVPPEIMGIGPVPAVRAILGRQNLSLADIDLVEINEAFAAQVIACDRDLHFDEEALNVNGGADPLGHPIGCTARRLT